MAEKQVTAQKTKKFNRAVKDVSEKTDKEGKVIVFIAMRNGQKYLKGNITKTITVHDAKVSEVFEAIDEALF